MLFLSELHLNKGYIFQCLLWYLFRTINEFINYSPLILPHLRIGDIFLAILRKPLLPRLLKPPKKSQCGQKYLKLKMSWIFTVSQYGYIILKHLNGFSELFKSNLGQNHCLWKHHEASIVRKTVRFWISDLNIDLVEISFDQFSKLKRFESSNTTF